MSIWSYDFVPDEINSDVAQFKSCFFCRGDLNTNFLERHEVPNSWEKLIVRRCNSCGWWNAEYVAKQQSPHAGDYIWTNLGYGILKKLDLANVNTPISEISDYLTGKYQEVHNLHPRIMEEVVGSVFKNLGYHSVISNYSNDKGIDVILHDTQSNLIGVQVKKYKRKIEAYQIREFTGALMLGDYTKGIFVTTSKFRKGANNTAQLSGVKGIPIELVDATKFYDALKLSQANMTREELTWDSLPIDKFKEYDFGEYLVDADGTKHDIMH